MKKLFIAALFFLPVTGVHALTLSQVQTEIRVRTKDNFVSRQRYSDAQLTSLINEAQRDVINNSWVISRSSSFATTSGTTYYSLPTDMLNIQRVTSANQNIPEVTLIKQDGDSGNSSWETSTGLPQSYFQDPAQSNKIGIYPFPSTVTSTAIVKVIYNAQTPDLSAASDIPFNSEARYYPYHDLLIFYASYRIFLIEGESDKYTIYRQEYESRLQVMISAIGKKSNYTPGLSGPANSR